MYQVVFYTMHDLTGFQRDALRVIAAQDDIHGLGVKAELDEYYGEEQGHGRIYPNLDTLVNKGLVSKTARDERTNEYRVTDRGWREIEARADWLNGLGRRSNGDKR